MPRLPRHLTALAVLGLAACLAALTTGCGSNGDISAAPGDSSPRRAGEPANASGPATTAPAEPSTTEAATTTPGAADATDATDPAAQSVDRSTLSGAPTDDPAASAGAAGTTTQDAAAALDAVDAALADGDLCGVYEGLAAYDVNGTSTAKLREQMTRILDVMRRARTLVPSGLVTDWDTVTAGTEEMLDSLAKGDDHGPDDFDADAYHGAAQHVGDWMERNCA